MSSTGALRARARSTPTPESHVQANEGDPAKRAFTKKELHAFFAHCDDEVARIRAFGRKGWLPAFRDATLFKTAYAYSLFSGAPTERGSLIP